MIFYLNYLNIVPNQNSISNFSSESKKNLIYIEYVDLKNEEVEISIVNQFNSHTSISAKIVSLNLYSGDLIGLLN